MRNEKQVSHERVVSNGKPTKPNKPTGNNKTKKLLSPENRKAKVEVIPLQSPLFPMGVPDLTKHTELQKSLEEKLKSSQFRCI
jgi:hypothetical protein